MSDAEFMQRTKGKFMLGSYLEPETMKSKGAIVFVPDDYVGVDLINIEADAVIFTEKFDPFKSPNDEATE